jgi:hypothetical protein
MKAKLKKTVSILLLLITAQLSLAQNQQPLWVADINALPDTVSHITPVKILTDVNGNIYTLSNFMNTNIPNSPDYKVYLRKYNMQGNVLWTYISSNALPRAFDMAIDNNGNCYIVGGLMSPIANQPFVMKVTNNGTLSWQQNGNNSFNLDWYNKIILKQNMLYLSSSLGIVKYSLGGVEQWSNNYSNSCMAVDNIGQVVFSGYSNVNTLFRLDNNGNINLSDSTINAQHIAIDSNNDIYLIACESFPGTYNLVKYNNNGIQQWSYNQFPVSPPFGDFAMELLVDGSNNLWAIGLQDSMFCFSPQGNLNWAKSMHGLDNYMIATNLNWNSVFIVGSTPSFGGFSITATLFNSLGNPSWTTTYNGVVNGQEFAQDIFYDGNGLYLLENLEQNTRLIKYADPLSNNNVNFNDICVDSVWYDIASNNRINVRIFNNNLGFINYPSLQILAPTGDTISNHNNSVNFFGQEFNTYQTYTDSISVTGITDFSSYTFLLSVAFADTTGQISWCSSTTKIEIFESETLKIFPNPVSSFLHINSSSSNLKYSIFSSLGVEVLSNSITSNQGAMFDFSYLASGLYFMKVDDGHKIITRKIIKE